MKKIITTIIAFLMLFASFVAVSADNKPKEGPSFTIEPIFPQNQIDQEAGYFHLDIQEYQKQTIDVIIHNNADKEQVFELYFNIAKTNRNGLIVYADELAEGPNHTLPVNIEEIVQISNNVITLPAQSQKKIQMNLDYEGLEYPGILMGALTVREHLDPGEQGISHQYQYTIGVVLSQDGQKDLPGSQSFEMKDVSLGIDAGHKVLDYYVNNYESNIARNLVFESTLTNLDTQKQIFNKKVEDFSIAPNGRLPLRIDWLKKEVEPGRYRLKLKMNEGEEVWEHDFIIEQDEAQKINEKASYKVRIPSWVLSISLLLGFLTLLNTIYLVHRQNKREE